MNVTTRITLAAVLLATPAVAQMNMPMGGMGMGGMGAPAAPQAAPAAPMDMGAALPAGATGTVIGEVRAIDRDSNKITVAHEPIAEFNMRAMTMVVQATAPQLSGLAVGDRIKATVVRNGGAFAVQTIAKEPAAPAAAR